jgi:hypothetical protein
MCFQEFGHAGQLTGKVCMGLGNIYMLLVLWCLLMYSTVSSVLLAWEGVSTGCMLMETTKCVSESCSDRLCIL